MPVYICVREDEVREDNLLPVIIRTVLCEEAGDSERTLLVLWVDSPSPGLQSFQSALGEAWRNPERQEGVKKVIRDVDNLYEPKRGSEEYVLYVALAEALIAFLEAEPLLGDEFVKSYRALYRKFRGELALTEAPARNRFTLCFRMKDVGEELEVDIIAPSNDKRLHRQYYNALKRLVQGPEKDERVHDVVSRFSNFTKSVVPKSIEAKHLCEFAKALLDFADEAPQALVAELRSKADLRAGIYEFIITNESSVEQRKAYLDKFVAVEEDYGTEKRTFANIIRGLKRDQIEPGIARQTGMLIATYCLKVYDLGNAAKVLKDVESLEHRGISISSLILKMASSMYSRTSHWIIGFSLLLLAVIGPALLRGSVIPTTLPLYQLLEWASRIVLYLFYLGAIVLPTVVLGKSRQDRVPYFQLFFPRLLGATVVGFTPLMFDETPWKIGCSDEWFTIILIGALSYLASVTYVYVDAHKMLTTIRSGEWNSIMHTAGRLFWIGLMQSVTIAVIVSTLLSSVIWDNEVRGIMVDCFLGSVGIYPTLIFVWAGIALFVGAFAQLLWQAGRVTEPL